MKITEGFMFLAPSSFSPFMNFYPSGKKNIIRDFRPHGDGTLSDTWKLALPGGVFNLEIQYRASVVHIV